MGLSSNTLTALFTDLRIVHQLHFKVTHSCHSTTAVDGEYSPIHATRPRRYPWPSFLLRKAMVLFSSLLLPSRTLPNHPLCHGKKLIPSLLSDVTFDNVVENGNQCHVKEFHFTLYSMNTAIVNAEALNRITDATGRIICHVYAKAFRSPNSSFRAMKE